MPGLARLQPPIYLVPPSLEVRAMEVRPVYPLAGFNLFLRPFQTRQVLSFHVALRLLWMFDDVENANRFN
jgi:hypothetical protein